VADAEKDEAADGGMTAPEPALPDSKTSDDSDFEDFNPDVLDSLIEDLSQKVGDTAPPPSSPAGGPSPGEPVDRPVSDGPDKAPPKKELLKIETEPSDQPAFDANELDALLDELGAKSPDQLSPQDKSIGSEFLNSEDLDSLLAEIAPNAMNAPAAPDLAPVAAKKSENNEEWPEPAPAPPGSDKTDLLSGQDEADGDDLDKFLSDLQAAEVIKEVELAPAELLRSAPEPQDELDDDLDSLLADLEGGLIAESKTGPEKPAPAIDDWDLDLPVSEAEPAANELIPDKPAQGTAVIDSHHESPSQDSQILQVVMNPALEAALLKLTPALTPETAREIYQTVLTEVLNQVIPKLAGQEVARQVNLEIDAIKRLAGID
jgi:hypothetical protein